MASALNVSAAGYTALSVSGSAVEAGGDFEMKHIAPEGTTSPKFVAYLQLNPGSFTLTGADSTGAAVTLGKGDKEGALTAGGDPVEVTEQQIVRLTLNCNDNSLEILPIESLNLKGSIVPDNTTLDYIGRGVWSSTVTLDKEVNTHDYPSHYFYFALNNDDNLAVKRHWGTPNVDMLSHGYQVENIRLNNGTYTITLDMAAHTFDIDCELDPLRVSVFGSSVANGSGATNMEGYAYLYGQQLRQRYADGVSPNAFYTSGVSIGGNNTGSLLNRYDDLLHDFSHYVIIGLSLGNEGIHDNANPDNVFNGFRDNMLRLISMMRADGKEPVVVNNYARSDFNERDHDYVKRMNMLIHEWDVPSINSLGAIEDGAGRWSQGYINDPSHPNTLGHQEFLYAFVPSLFDALAEGKPLPERDLSKETLLENGEVITLSPEGKVHPFTICVRVKGTGAGRLFSFLHGAGSRPFTGSLDVDADGKITYNSPLKKPVTTENAVMADGDWHDIALSHYFARGCTLLYVDGELAGTVDERLTLGDVTFGDNSELLSPRTYSEITFWRSGMTTEEMAAHHQGKMLKSSLEIYSPMTIDTDGKIANLAQSTNALTTDSSASIETIASEKDSFRVEGGAGMATFFSDGTVENVYTLDGRLVATLTASPFGTTLPLQPGLYLARTLRFRVR